MPGIKPDHVAMLVHSTESASSVTQDLQCHPQVEDPKKALLLYGGRTSQTVKDVLSDFGKLKGVSSFFVLTLRPSGHDWWGMLHGMQAEVADCARKW